MQYELNVLEMWSVKNNKRKEKHVQESHMKTLVYILEYISKYTKLAPEKHC